MTGAVAGTTTTMLPATLTTAEGSLVLLQAAIQQALFPLIKQTITTVQEHLLMMPKA
jgi:hypothetical protein